ncbi:hypothetical protein B9Z19DRAFT_1100738 [Tuber borchii]|uniref:DUF6536 domain-containing protein n=1 Tax=Tuber borchii TaxID=42251 RepID=A0A2T6ZVV0_TUBBO|nr:hypothetical protein B9Z19DRAFT_1100738 [Tuber borchii]
MSNLRTKLPKWTALLLGDYNSDKRGGSRGGGGSRSSSIESLTSDSEFTREQPNSSLVSRPVWDTGWYTGVLACATSVVIVLLINICLTTYAATNPEYKMERGIGTLYLGSCDKSRTIGLWLHLGINALSTLLLSGSNYTQQQSPTRSEIDAAHMRRRWMDVGVPSIRNLFKIKVERIFLWIAIGITSIPLHLLYKTSGTIQQYSHDIQQFINMIEGHNTSTQSYEDLTSSQCTSLYNTDFMSSHRNLFVIANYTPNAMLNNTILSAFYVGSTMSSPGSWMCPAGLQHSVRCKPNEITSRVASGLPWLVGLSAREEVEVSGCKSEKVADKCEVKFSLGIMIAVICCNLPTLVTLGDAIDSFLRIPDPTTMGICFADRRFIKREWGRGWWNSVSKTRWITCNFFCSIAIIITGVLLGMGIGQERRLVSTDFNSLGFGKLSNVSLVTIRFQNITQAILLANLPQTILSFLYLTYNSLFTCMLVGHEWSLFSHHHRTLRVTSPRPGQRSTHWLQIPYTYAIPLMTLSGLLHWLTSQSIFLARVDFWEPFGREVIRTMSTVGYSCITIFFALSLGILALLTAVGMGYKPFSAEITTAGSCSAAISAAWKKVRWGDVEIVPNLRVRHLTFSSEEGVRKPVLGEVYVGVGE